MSQTVSINTEAIKGDVITVRLLTIKTNLLDILRDKKLTETRQFKVSIKYLKIMMNRLQTQGANQDDMINYARVVASSYTTNQYTQQLKYHDKLSTIM